MPNNCGRVRDLSQAGGKCSAVILCRFTLFLSWSSQVLPTSHGSCDALSKLRQRLGKDNPSVPEDFYYDLFFCGQKGKM